MSSFRFSRVRAKDNTGSVTEDTQRQMKLILFPDVRIHNVPAHKKPNRSPAKRLRFEKEETWSTDGKTATAKAIAVFLPCGMISDVGRSAGICMHPGAWMHRDIGIAQSADWTMQPHPAAAMMIQIPAQHNMKADPSKDGSVFMVRVFITDLGI